MPQILGDDKIAEDINYLNSKQKKEFSEVHRWAKDCISVIGIMLNLPTYFFQAVEARVKLIW